MTPERVNLDEVIDIMIGEAVEWERNRLLIAVDNDDCWIWEGNVQANLIKLIEGGNPQPVAGESATKEVA
jgi:hypothetical protein